MYFNKIKDKFITDKTFRIYYEDYIIHRFHCISFVEYIVAGQALVGYANLFSPNEYQKNVKIVFK